MVEVTRESIVETARIAGVQFGGKLSLRDFQQHWNMASVFDIYRLFPRGWIEVCELAGLDMPDASPLGLHQRWGIGEMYFIAVGQIDIAFQQLEWDLGYMVHILRADEKTIYRCVIDETSFEKLERAAKDFKSRVKQFGEKHPNTVRLFERATKKAHKARYSRNAIIHSQWGFKSADELVIENRKAKPVPLLLVKHPTDNPCELFAAVEKIERARSAVNEFSGLFVGAFHEEYVNRFGAK